MRNICIRGQQKEEFSYDVTIKDATGGHVNEFGKTTRRNHTENVP